MVLDLVEEVVPAPDDAALVLVVDQVQLVRLPLLADLDGSNFRVHDQDKLYNCAKWIDPRVSCRLLFRPVVIKLLWLTTTLPVSNVFLT